MSTNKIFNQIGQDQIDERQVSSLALRPNEPSQYGIGGLSGKQLQQHFDKLAKLVITRYNEMARVLSSNEVLEYLQLPETITNDDLSTLRDLLGKLVDADGDIIVETPTDDKIKDKIKNVLKSQASNISALQASVEILNDATGKVPSTVEMHLNEDDYKLSVTIKNHLGEAISTSEIDFPIEESVVGMTFDEKTKKLHLSLRNGTSLDVDISDIFTGVVTSLTDPSTNKALAASTGAVILQRIADAVKPVQDQVEILRQRVDSINVPIVHNSLYEHNILLTASTSDGVYTQATLRLAILSEEAEEFSAGDVLAYLNYKSNAGNVIKAYSGYVAYESVPGATDSKITISHIANLRTISNTSMAIVYYDDDGFENELIVNTYATVIDNVRIVANVDDIDNADYEENDPYSKSYIKNRPFYETNKTLVGEFTPSAKDKSSNLCDATFGFASENVPKQEEFSNYEVNILFDRSNAGLPSIQENHLLSEFEISSGNDLDSHLLLTLKHSICDVKVLIMRDYDSFGAVYLGNFGANGIYLGDNVKVTNYDIGIGLESVRVYSRVQMLHKYSRELKKLDNKYLDLANNEEFKALEAKVGSGSTGNTFFVGTLAEYEAQKDTIPVGTLIIITDEGDEESAILGQAILGKMILGKGA